MNIKPYQTSQITLITVLLLLLGCISPSTGQTVYQLKKNLNRVKRTGKSLSRTFSQKKRQITKEESMVDTIIWEKPTYIPQRGVINKYPRTYRTINGETQKVMFKNADGLSHIVWDSLSNKYFNRLDKIDALRDSVEVFGWHPYWMENAYESYKFNLLSTLSYFSYDINTANGSYNDKDAIDDWKDTKLIDIAHKHKVKVLLTVTNYGEEDNRLFLKDRSLWNPLVDSLKYLLQYRKAQGIDLDFEGVPTNLKSEFTDFVRKVATEIGQDSILTVQVKPFNNSGAIDFAALDDYVDYFILQGFDYSNIGCNGAPGPVSPLLSINSDCACIVNSFDYCLRQGLSADKIVLGLPAYGTQWKLTGSGANIIPTFERYITYDDIISEYSTKYEPFYDPLTGSTFFNIQKPNNTTEIVWYESATSMDRKFSWANDHDLKGVAIWALGYDGGHSDIWNAIATNFGKPIIQEIQPISVENGPVYGVVEIVVKNRRAFGLGVLIILGFLITGLFLSLLDGKVREAFFGSFAYRAIYSGVLILLFSIGILMVFPTLKGQFLLFLGMVIGGLIVYLVTNRYLEYRNKLP